MKLGLPTFNVYVFNALPGETIPLFATSVSSSVTFNLAASAKNYDVMVTNAGSKTAYIAFGTTTAVTATMPMTATTTLYATPVLAGAIYTFQKNPGFDVSTVAAITAAGEATTLYFTSVQGS